MNNDVIRITNGQKEDIEKLIPAILKECEGSCYSNFLAKRIEERDYSYIIRMLICKAAEAYNIDIYN